MTTRTTRKKWSAKKKAQVLILGTMIFLVVVILLLPHAFAYEDPKHCYGYSDCYSIGETRGQSNAYSDYWSYRSYNPNCPTDESHSKAYCNGYSQGYYVQWKYLAWNGPRYADKVHQLKQQSDQSIGQSSDVSIKGNNNRVTVNQGASNNNANNADGGGGSDSGNNNGRLQPSCKIICSIIKIVGS
jgi:hypothetical protein